jgi:hypothetical protein
MQINRVYIGMVYKENYYNLYLIPGHDVPSLVDTLIASCSESHWTEFTLVGLLFSVDPHMNV